MKMKVSWKIKPFKRLTPTELYETLQLRSEVFVVEQNCVYLDMDGKDMKSLFVLGIYENKIVAHARLLDSGISYENPSIGRVVVHIDYRKNNLGHELMQHAIAGIESHFGKKQITISAQVYLQKFYESHGFVPESEIYLEDDIPHIKMTKRA